MEYEDNDIALNKIEIKRKRDFIFISSGKKRGNSRRTANSFPWKTAAQRDMTHTEMSCVKTTCPKECGVKK